MTLQEDIAAMHTAQKAVAEATKKKQVEAAKLKVKRKAIEKAKKEPEFEKLKKDALAQLKKVTDAIEEEKKATKTWEEKMNAVKKQHMQDTINLKRMQQEMLFNLEKCKKYNQDVRAFNKQLQEAQKAGRRKDEKPKDTIPELDVDKTLRPQFQAWDDAQLDIVTTDASVTWNKSNQKMDTEKGEEVKKEITDQTFGGKGKK